MKDFSQYLYGTYCNTYNCLDHCFLTSSWIIYLDLLINSTLYYYAGNNKSSNWLLYTWSMVLWQLLGLENQKNCDSCNNVCNFSGDDIIVKNSFSKKILGLTINNNLDFSDHMCKTANLNALFRVSTNMNSGEYSLLINSFIKSHFSYCPLMWMFCNQQSTKKVKKYKNFMFKVTVMQII